MRLLLRVLMDEKRARRIRREVAAAELHGTPAALAGLAHAAVLRRAAEEAEGFAAERCVAKLLQLVAWGSARRRHNPTGGEGGSPSPPAPTCAGDLAPSGVGSRDKEWGRLLFAAALCVGRWGEVKGALLEARREEARWTDALAAARASAEANVRRIAELLAWHDRVAAQQVRPRVPAG